MTRDDVEWLDERAGDDGTEETLAAGSHRPPLRRRTRIVLGAAGVALLAGAVTVGIATSGSEPTPAVTRTVPPVRSSERTFAIEPVDLPGQAPRQALAAIRAAFPGADLTSFVAATSPGTDGTPSLIYNLRAGRRTLTVSVRPTRPTDRDASNRGARSIELVQQIGTRTVGVLVRRATTPTTDRDFVRAQQLIRDTRLLAAG